MYFVDYEEPTLLQEPNLFNYGLENEDTFLAQNKIITKLETKFKITNTPKFQNLVHFQGANKTPIQRWFPYREGYATQLVHSFLKELDIKKNVFDPFCGSGTTLLASRHNNIQSFGIDINPISALVSRVENESYTNLDKKDLKAIFAEITNLEKSTEIFKSNFDLSDKTFNAEILQTVLQLLDFTQKIANEKVRNICFVTWLAIVEQVSNVKKEGNGIKYKNRKRTENGYININKEEWEKSQFPENKFTFVKQKFLNHLQNIINDLENDYGNIEKKPAIFNGNCLELDKYINKEVQFTFFSPPYCNCFDYFEIHKVELWLGHFVKTKEEFRALRNTGFRSNTNAILNKNIDYKNDNLEKLISLFDSQKLWHKSIPKVVRGYFDDMHTLLQKTYLLTEKNGFVGIVVGNSAYTGVVIPTDLLIAEMASEIGFKVHNIFVTRHLTTSSQQKRQLEPLKNYLRESIIFLQKCN
jgi:DNA modification methylase